LPIAYLFDAWRSAAHLKANRNIYLNSWPACHLIHALARLNECSSYARACASDLTASMVPWRLTLRFFDDIGFPGHNIHNVVSHGLHFFGEVPTRLCIATMEEEFYLELDMLNTNMEPQWLTVAQIADAVRSAREFHMSHPRRLMENNSHMEQDEDSSSSTWNQRNLHRVIDDDDQN